MTLHEYAIIGHKRSEIGRYLGLGSLLLAPLVTGAITWFSQWHMLTTSLQGKMALFTVSTGTIYAALYWLFNRFGWRWLDKVLNIPNLAGQWTVIGESLDLDGAIKFPWKATPTITQRWDRIAISLKTDQSSSHSETASMLLHANGEAKLSYSYQNHPRAGEPELSKHQGFCELVFDSAARSAKGHYFNSMGRYSFGRMALEKQQGA